MASVSIIMGVYNAEKYLEPAIESILNQTYRDFEFVICDDGSTDKTKEIVKNYVQRDQRIVWIENTANKGLGFSLNKCIDVSKGKYLVRMDGDDISTQNRVEKLVKLMDENPQYAVIGSGMILFDEAGEWGKSNPILKPNKMQVFKGPAVAHATTIMNASIIKKIGGYNSECDKYHAEDYDLWCRLVEADQSIMSTPDLLYKCRWDKVEYYKRRKVAYLIGYANLKFYWSKRFKMGFPGLLHCSITYVKAIIPSGIKKMYHQARLKK